MTAFLIGTRMMGYWSLILDVKTWIFSPRGAGWLFGKEVVEKFLNDNNIAMIVRAHQLAMDGWKSHFEDLVITVWSAPNYCYRCGNVASILELDENLEKMYKIFEDAPDEERNKEAKFPLSNYIS